VGLEKMIDNTRQKILDIIETKPKHYTRIIKNDNNLYNWVMDHKRTMSENISAQIYSAVYDISDKCVYDNIKKFDRWSTGFIGCGPSSRCICTRETISKSVIETKSQLNSIEIEKSNIKRKATMLSKYGVEYNSQRVEIKDILCKSKLTNHNNTLLNNYEWLYLQYETNKRTSVDIAQEIGVHYSTVLEHLKKYNFDIRKTNNYSIEENEIKKFIKDDLRFSIIENDRNILDGKELDIFIPSANLAIEHNGLYWHSYGKNDIENSRYHLYKKEKCLEKGINLIYITDYEWNNKRDIIKSMIKSKLGINTKIYARKCDIIELKSAEARKFFDNNHLSGFISSRNYIGLLYNDNVVMCMSFGKNRFGEGIELHRMASLLGNNVIGGASKILKYYVKNYPIDKIHTYCDFSHSDGSGYKCIGFNFIGKSDPNYFWTDRKNIISRYKTRHKSQLSKILGNLYDSKLSERDNMMNAGYRRYWGCGNLIFEYIV
jgi:hypothetical protein